MDEPDFQSLTQFCAEQFSAFESDAWIRICPFNRQVIAVTSKYLSMTSWYGHADELERIAFGIDASILNVSQLHLKTLAIGLNLMTLSASLRYKIALRQILHAQLITAACRTAIDSLDASNCGNAGQ